MAKQEKMDFYSLKRILEKDARYNIIFGERSNGKTYAVLEYAYKEYLKSGKQLAIIRRWDEDFIGANSSRVCYESLMSNKDGKNIIKEYSKGRYQGVQYYSGNYYLTAYDNEKDKTFRTDKIIAIAFSINSQEHYKGSSFPNVKYILFDEFITRKYYLVDEFINFQQLLSTIIRTRDDVTIFMCGNTINKYGCPYYTEMGLNHIKKMQQGDIDTYTYGDSGLVVAVEYSDGVGKNKPSDVYFAFDNPRLKMITNGSWEMDIYPHLPIKYKPKDILFVYFIIFDEQTLQCEVIQVDDVIFTYIHRKTTEIKDYNVDYIFQPDSSPRANIGRKITKPRDKVGERIWTFFRNDKVFYQDNEVGEIVRSYLMWCNKSN